MTMQAPGELLDPAASERAWTPAQRQAITARTRTLVTAAAGSGKTSVLTELVAQALAARELEPSQVCAVTFTEKAAQEMRGRIAARLLELGERDLLAELELARIGTIHSLCAAILRMHGAAVGIDPAVGQLEESQLAWIKRSAYRAAIEDTDDPRDDELVHWARARMGDARIEELLEGILRWAVQGDGDARLVDAAAIEGLLDTKTGEWTVTAQDARRTIGALQALWQRFHGGIEARKQELGRISFDDLERLAVDAVRIPHVRADLRARWGLVLVDEFQDTNARQYELLDAIGGERLFMVGDEWQSIYRFRGADVDVFRARRDEPGGGVVIPMRENFRSDAPILDVVNHVFGHELLFGDRYEPVRVGTPRQQDADAPAVELLVVPSCELEEDAAGGGVTAGASPRECEALRVAERIAELVESRHAAPGDIAVLYAKGTGIDCYERALQAWGLPVLRGASDGYYDQRDVRDVLAVLACVRNHADDLATASVLAGPVGGLTWGELGLLRRAAEQAGTSLLDAARSSELAGARAAIELVDGLELHQRSGSLVELVSGVVRWPAFELGAASQRDGVARIANLRRLVELAASADQVGVRDVTGFLEFVDAQRRDARIGEASIADEGSGAIRLMTVHASKGLEFPHVFVVEAGSTGGRSGGLMPPVLCDGDGIVHVALPGRDGRGERTAALEELCAADAQAQQEETLRLWYVAMTRAEHRLYISGRYDFRSTKAGAPRSLPGALRWLSGALDLAPGFGGADVTGLDSAGLVRVDTRSARAEPRAVWHSDRVGVTLARPLQLPVASADDASEPAPQPDPAALQALLRDSVTSARSDEWRQLDGTRIHDAVARLLHAARSGTALAALLDPERGPWLTDSVRTRLEPVVASTVFTELVRRGARTEVPYVASAGASVPSRAVPGINVAASAAQVDAGRIDALTMLEDGRWWVVDWKTTLPLEPEEAWRLHGEQLLRYARVAVASGAHGAVVTLVPLDRPDAAVSWQLDSAADGSGLGAPRRASIPAST